MAAEQWSLLICYDICDKRRLRKVHRVVRDASIPVQFSVFEAELKERELNKLVAELNKIIEPTEDKIHIYRLMKTKNKVCLGMAVEIKEMLFL